jgi:hypothetical protein
MATFSAFVLADSSTMLEGFESGEKPSYAAGNVLLGTGVWNLNDALIGGDAADRKNGARSVRIRNSGKLSMTFDRSTGAGRVSIQHARYGNDQNTSWQFWCSTDRGGSWTQIGATIITTSTSLQTATFNSNLPGEVRCEIRKIDGTANRTNIDDIQIGDYVSGPLPTPSPSPTIPSPTPTPSVLPLPSGTVPFFDRQDNPVSGLKYPARSSVDVTPEPPILNAFDRAVAKICGAPGKQVSQAEFKTLMNNHPEILARIKTRMGFATTVPNVTFLNSLTSVWFNAAGFDHVFCGEPVAGGSIGGLHFFGRYLDLQERGLAGRLADNTASEEVVPGAIYTVGAKVRVNGGSAQSRVKGYGYTLDAEDILAIAGAAYTRNPNSSATSRACNLSINDDGKTFIAIFVAKTSGIRTFYPDATPDRSNPTCKL